MTIYNNTDFTEHVLRRYAEVLRERLQKSKFILDDGATVSRAIRDGMFHPVTEYCDMLLEFTLDDFYRRDGSVDERMLADAVATGLAEPVIVEAEKACDNDPDNPFSHIGAGQLWVVHKALPLPIPIAGGPSTHFARQEKIGVFGQSWFDNKRLQSKFLAKTSWRLVRSREIKKEPLTAPTVP